MTELFTLTAPTAADLERLRYALGDMAESRGDLDLAYRTVDSPLGELLLAASPIGVVRVAFADEGFDAVLNDLSARVSPRVLRAPRRLDPIASQLEAYFRGARTEFEVDFDHRLARGFRQEAQRQLSDIGYGTTASYAALAAAVGRPRAVRAVASACATNPLPILLPCHRVVRSDGSLGGYRGGTAAKRLLLDLEARNSR